MRKPTIKILLTWKKKEFEDCIIKQINFIMLFYVDNKNEKKKENYPGAAFLKIIEHKKLYIDWMKWSPIYESKIWQSCNFC